MPEPTPDDLLARFRRRHCPVCDQLVGRGFAPGPGGRPDARCRRCGSLERHRFFVLLLDMLRVSQPPVDVLLEVAPAAETRRYLADFPARRHVRLDLGADNRSVDVLASLTDVPLADDSVDLLVCYHVLEHIPDDKAAMAEIARVLKPSGVALLQVPFRPGTTTDEDPDAPEDERVRRFGQADHVRYYGDDFEDRLAAVGLSFERVTPREVVGERACTWMHLVPDEFVWIARSTGGAAVPPPGVVASPAIRRSFDRLVGQMVTHHARADRLQAERDALAAPSLPRRAARRVRRTVRRPA